MAQRTPCKSTWYQAYRFKKKMVPTDDGLEFDLVPDEPLGPPHRTQALAREDLGSRKETKRYAYRVAIIWPAYALRRR